MNYKNLDHKGFLKKASPLNWIRKIIKIPLEKIMQKGITRTRLIYDETRNLYTDMKSSLSYI